MSLLQLTADLERRDATLAVEIATVAELAGRAEAVGATATGLDDLRARVPDQLAAAEVAQAEQHERHADAQAALAQAEKRVAAIERERRPRDDARAHALRDLLHAREMLADADAGTDRLRKLRADLGADETSARVGASALVLEAEDVADRLAAVPSVSDSGRSRPDATLPGLVAWAARVHASLLVVRGQLDGERELLVREANELGSSVVGEPLAGQSVDLVGRRIRAALRG